MTVNMVHIYVKSAVAVWLGSPQFCSTADKGLQTGNATAVKSGDSLYLSDTGREPQSGSTRWKEKGGTDTEESWLILASNHSSKHFGYIDIKTAFRAHNKTEQLNQPHTVCPANSHMGSSAICASDFLWTPPLAKCAWTQALPIREEWCSPDRGYTHCRTRLQGCDPCTHLHLIFRALSAHLSPCTFCFKLIEETAVWPF